MINDIENCIEEAWRITGKEFSSEINPKAVFWKEQAAMKYPFYYNLRKLLESHKSQEIALVPEYNPNTPVFVLRHNKQCSCDKLKRSEGQNLMHIDLCLVKFDKTIRRIDIQQEKKYLWCFNPQPLVAMEFKYYFSFGRKSAETDVKKLIEMGKRCGATTLLYFCFATYNSYIAEARRHLESIMSKEESSVKKKFRLGIGTLENDVWIVNKYTDIVESN